MDGCGARPLRSMAARRGAARGGGKQKPRAGLESGGCMRAEPCWRRAGRSVTWCATGGRPRLGSRSTRRDTRTDAPDSQLLARLLPAQWLGAGRVTWRDASPQGLLGFASCHPLIRRASHYLSLRRVRAQCTLPSRARRGWPHSFHLDCMCTHMHMHMHMHMHICAMSMTMSM